MLKNDLQKHVESHCATYNRDGKCHLETSPGCNQCPFFREGDGFGRCAYFENAVLPADDKLKARYWQAFGAAYWGDKPNAVCKRCEQPYERKSNRQVYCESCAAQVRAENKAARNRRYYQQNKGEH
ncbi:hypothetical protein JOD43_003909 [Pullulanibacillus pueri]|uniref:Cysteine-rich VLP domain-containing protein n=1 Tax=Pullulanibacillus pueri TaxID=1437324 RepID=A0A8J2ZXW6_9BACL|nr:hypothetical protein [Pullulanibacillus pueri]MBM7683729.1 hypothetical protein [Pullulanibacillus pueri]GGH85141.1 hypothetical protein GCM10007096_29840 [Pullulanibacillus pueri]